MSKQHNKKRINIKKLIPIAIWTFKKFFKLSKRDTILLGATHFIKSFVPIAKSFAYAKMLDSIIDISSGNQNLKEALSLNHPLFISILLTAIFSTLNGLVFKWQRYFLRRFERHHIKLFEFEVHKKISDIDIQQHEDPKISDITRRATENMYTFMYFIEVTFAFISKIITTIATLGIISTISPYFIILMIVFAIPINILSNKQNAKIWRVQEKFTETRRRIGGFLYSLKDTKRLPEQKISQSNRYIYSKGKHTAEPYYKELLKNLKMKMGVKYLSEAIYFLMNLAIPLYLVGMIMNGEITVGEFGFYQTNYFVFMGSINEISTFVTDLLDRGFYVSQLKEAYELDNEIKSGNIKINESKPPEIEFKNVSFKYPKTDELVLKNVNFKINSGEEVAIVGENGAGKTTIIKLILRFYDPTGGEILINGKNLKNIDLEIYHEITGALFQDYNFYGMLSAKENIAIGKPEKKPDFEKIVEAAKKADAHKFIKALDNKYETLMSKRFKNGTNLSTGQMQKVALARMFYRDSQLLILDEPTASIDASAESRIFERIYQFMENKTVIIISHRFSTVRNAQRIFVLEDGELVENGSHQNLIKNNGLYKKNFELQAKGYN